MSVSDFHHGWTVQPDRGEARPVRLPHDAMLGARRSADAPSRYHGAWFHGERYTYRKQWTPGPDIAVKRVDLIFEGVQRASVVSLDGVELARNGNGYREFAVDLTALLTPGRTHSIEVVADARNLPNGRWYSGAGIYRPVRLRVTDRTRFAWDGIVPTTRSITGDAEVVVTVDVDISDSEEPQDLRVDVVLSDGAVEVASAHAVVDAGRAEAVLTVSSPRLWSDLEPALYDCEVTLRRDGTAIDSRTLRVGIRTLDLDTERGLLLNGVPTRLRGGNVHHDNGILGAVSTPAAEQRRARILKDVGYNAIRSAHNPMSRALLDACDAVGILVLDELTDVWWDPKTAHDDSADFDTDWPVDLAAMVRRDRSHPCVFAYSIGNENGETGTRSGVQLAQRMRALVRELDDTRPVTAGVNLGLTSATASQAKRRGDPERDPAVRKQATHPPLDSTKFNILFGAIGPLMELTTKLPSTERGTRPIFDVLDVAGYNYGVGRYTKDLAQHEKRFILGSETMPGDIARVWPLVEQNPRLLGDFVWSAWDYLGETGIGTWVHGRRFAPLMKAYPALVAGPGAIDIAGTPGAQTLLARAAWGVTEEPGIAVRPLQFAGQPVARAAWRSTDAVPSWSWRGMDGTPADVEVYSAADTVELVLNGRTVGRKEAGPRHSYVARFHVPYEPGLLEAVAVRRGHEVSKSALRSATGPLQLSLRQDGGDAEMAFIEVLVTDSSGTVEMLSDVEVTVSVFGADLAAFGSAAPATDESFLDAVHTTFYGRALAVIRFDPTPDDREVIVRARAPHLAGAELHTTTGDRLAVAANYPHLCPHRNHTA